MKNLKYEYTNILKNIDNCFIESLKDLELQNFISKLLSLHLDFLENNLDKNEITTNKSFLDKAKKRISPHTLFLMQRNQTIKKILDKYSKSDDFFNIKKQLSKYITMHDKQLLELLNNYSSDLKIESFLLYKKQRVSNEYFKNVF